MAEHSIGRFGPESRSVSLRFVQLIGGVAGRGDLVRDQPGQPGRGHPARLADRRAGRWATEVGLRDEPSAEVVVAAKKNEPTPVVGVAGAPAAGADRATVMQRTVPPAQVPFYLERGYDRVSGFVNRASEVAHLTSPRMLYRALGLVYSGLAVRRGRRRGARGALGGAPLRPVPAALRRPARGRRCGPCRAGSSSGRRSAATGSRPGDTDVVAEFKVDSVRLPHGAQMWRLAKDGTETLVATFDADAVTLGARRRSAGRHA